MKRIIKIAAYVIRKVKDWNRRGYNLIGASVAYLLGISGLAMGLYSHTWHNITLGILLIVFGTAYLKVDLADVKNPYEV